MDIFACEETLSLIVKLFPEVIYDSFCFVETAYYVLLCLPVACKYSQVSTGLLHAIKIILNQALRFFKELFAKKSLEKPNEKYLKT